MIEYLILLLEEKNTQQASEASVKASFIILTSSILEEKKELFDIFEIKKVKMIKKENKHNYLFWQIF